MVLTFRKWVRSFWIPPSSISWKSYFVSEKERESVCRTRRVTSIDRIGLDVSDDDVGLIEVWKLQTSLLKNVLYEAEAKMNDELTVNHQSSFTTFHPTIVQLFSSSSSFGNTFVLCCHRRLAAAQKYKTRLIWYTSCCCCCKLLLFPYFLNPCCSLKIVIIIIF